MIMQVVDGNGELQQIVVQSPGIPADRSGTIQASGVSQTLLDIVPDGSTRSGWLVQNNTASGFTMQINDLGSPADQGPTSVNLAPGEFFPPPGYPVTQGSVEIAGNVGDNFMAREW